MKNAKSILMKAVNRTAIVLLAFLLLTNPTFARQDDVKSSSVKPSVKSSEKIAALIVEGQNNHRNWPETTKMMEQYLLASGRFTVEIARTQPKGMEESFAPDFSKYGVVISNYNGTPWPEATKKAFVTYIRDGGGFVSVHAADNSFPAWREYNEIIGVGGWGGRTEANGPYVYFADKKLVVDKSKGRGGSHGAQHPFSIVVRNSDHPITKGMPTEWMHAKDELYDRLRGPAENMQVLATAFSSKKYGGTDRHEPMLMAIEYGKGRSFHTPMGHGNYSQECVGFITSFLRGAEWAATGKVTIPVPNDFPTAREEKSRKFQLKKDQTSVGPELMVQLKKRVAEMVEIVKNKDAREIIESLATPDEAKEFFDSDNVERNLKSFEEMKSSTLLVALETIKWDTAKKEGDVVKFETDGRSIKLTKIGDSWRIMN